MEFKFGDRVKHKELGTGTIKCVEDNSYAVEFDKGMPSLHTCGGNCKDHHGYWCSREGLEYAHEKAFAIGNRVYNCTYGYGTIKKISDCGSFYAIEFDDRHEKLHSCGGVTKSNRGWWCNVREIGLVVKEKVLTLKKAKTEDKPIVKLQTRRIYSRTLPNYVSDDVEKLIINEPYVIVELESGEIGKAKCHKDDKFDEVLGFNIAYRRALISKAKNDKIAEIAIVTDKYDSLLKELEEEIYFLSLDENAFYL